MNRITQKEIDEFELPDRPMTIREMSIWNLINQREIAKGKEDREMARQNYLNQKNGVFTDEA